MEIKLSGHGAYRHQYHVVWIPKYRKETLKGELKEFVEKHLFDIQEYHPDIEIENYSIHPISDIDKIPQPIKLLDIL